eukprot:403348098
MPKQEYQKVNNRSPSNVDMILQVLKKQEKSRNENGIIMIKTNQESYYPGDTIIGKILLRFNGNVEISDIVVSILSLEMVSFINSNKELVQQKNQLLEINQTLHKLTDRMLKAGDYTFDFQFTIPSDIPASFYYAYDLNVKAPLWIKHTIKCRVTDNNQQRILSYKLPFIIRDKPESSCDLYSKTVTEKVRPIACSFFNYGKIQIQAKQDPKLFEQDQQHFINLEFDVDNTKSTAQIKEINVSYTTHIEVYDENSKIVQSHQYLGAIYTLPGLPPKKKDAAPRKLKLPYKVQNKYLYSLRAKHAVNFKISDDEKFYMSRHQLGQTSGDRIKSHTLINISLVLQPKYCDYFKNIQLTLPLYQALQPSPQRKLYLMPEGFSPISLGETVIEATLFGETMVRNSTEITDLKRVTFGNFRTVTADTNILI